MAIEKLDQSELYGFPITDLETATAEETAAGISLPVIVTSGGTPAYKVVTTKTWSDYVATTTADAISAANAKVDAATAMLMQGVAGEGRWTCAGFALMVTVVVGILKEVADQTYEGESNALDWAFTCIGGVIGCGLWMM